MIKKWLNHRRLVCRTAAGVYVGLLLATVLFPAIVPPERERRIFWFPDSTRTALNAEMRFIPYRETRAKEIELYLRELFLGPAHMGSVPFIPRNVMLRSAILGDDETLYIDFSPNLIVLIEEFDSSLELLTETVDKNVQHNFPFVRKIVFTVGGQIPYVPRFGNPPLTKGRGAL